MRILNAGQNHFIAGGSDRYQMALAELLEGAGHQVIPFASQAARNLPSAWSPWFPQAADFTNPGLTDAARYVYNPDAARRLDALLTKHPVDLAHLHIYYGKLTASILPVLRRHRVPVVQTLHEYKLVCPVYTLQRNGHACRDCAAGRFHHALLNRCNRGSLARSALTTVESYTSAWLGARTQVAQFIATSDFVRRAVVDMGIPAEKVSTVHNFVADDAFLPPVARGSDVVFAGRIERNKGVFTLLDVAAAMPDVSFVFAGHGTASEEVAASVRERRLANVALRGFLAQPDLRALLAAARVAVVPSEWEEPFGLAVVEAMAAATPVVASRVGGIPEIITDGHDGFLCESGNAEAFCARLAQLLGNETLARTLGDAGRATAQARFSRQAHLAALESVYADVRGRC
jgi:glycosyltransferase involved in cell wall biosynthesis